MKIAVDIDDVLCHTMKPFLELVAEEKGIVKDYSLLTTYNARENFGFGVEETLELLKKIYLENPLELIEGSAEGIKKLKEKHELIFVTSRSLMFKEITLSFLKSFFVEGPVVYFSSDFVLGQGKKKEELCKALGIGIIVEDHDEHSLRYADNGIKVLLLDKPWNKKVSHKNIIRCYSWEEIVEKIEEIENGE